MSNAFARDQRMLKTQDEVLRAGLGPATEISIYHAAIPEIIEPCAKCNNALATKHQTMRDKLMWEGAGWQGGLHQATQGHTRPPQPRHPALKLLCRIRLSLCLRLQLEPKGLQKSNVLIASSDSCLHKFVGAFLNPSTNRE